MSPELAAIIEDVRGQKSINQQINEWLWNNAQGDHADRLANALRPVLASLGDDELDAFVDNAVSAIEILIAGRKRHRE
ncbi:hypothetical protein [Phyllobacterium leguminum]|uniref:Uncharacterized protein n=1 Tax=Phyllobacterium leguminum TaxID=314237 RepID=A0A318T9R9_9HYPH|nr:hypothetical protein [Phyllobacterium leguminum]PYE89629.1 hypothetical protein C7477_103137 [Phyllobacterium leguminum]